MVRPNEATPPKPTPARVEPVPADTQSPVVNPLSLELEVVPQSPPLIIISDSPYGEAAAPLDSPVGEVADLSDSLFGEVVALSDSPVGEAADLSDSLSGEAIDLSDSLVFPSDR